MRLLVVAEIFDRLLQLFAYRNSGILLQHVNDSYFSCCLLVLVRTTLLLHHLHEVLVLLVGSQLRLSHVYWMVVLLTIVLRLSHHW